MLHSTLSALIVSVASRYAQLSPSDVGIGIGGGRLVIDNVQLRADTFNGPNIPFHVHQGRAGRLRINVPWSALSSTPVQVYLENVHLIAGPKQVHLHQPSNPFHNRNRSVDLSSTHGEWHQTIVGRLLFNVSVEIYGLKVEYRDDQCVGIISIASLRANSAGPDWNQRFVSLLSNLDPEQPQASAVSMRKLVQLNGVHWVMIPRVKGAPPASEGLAVNEQAPSPQLSDRHLDLNSYESKSPILDGIAVTVRVLMCTGMALVADSVSPGLHAEVDVDIEETSVSLTAQQIKWIDQIIKQGFGVPQKQRTKLSTQHSPPDIKRRPRSPSAPQRDLQREHTSTPRTALATANGDPHKSSAEDTQSKAPSESGDNAAGYLEDTQLQTQSHSTLSADLESSVKREYAEETTSLDVVDREQDHTVVPANEDEVLLQQEGNISADDDGSVGGLSSFWHAIVGEYADDTVDDAAVALGLANGYTDVDEEEQYISEQNEDDADLQYARTAVNAAAAAAGRTFKLRLKTPDLAARDEVERLVAELRREREKRLELEEVENVLSEAEVRVQNSENEIRQLQERNAALVKELEDLERMTSQAGRNKDAMIRQMEAALVKAEKNLQAMCQNKYEHLNGEVKKTRNNEVPYESSPKSVQQESTMKPPESAVEVEQTEHGADVESVEQEDQVPLNAQARHTVEDSLANENIAEPMDDTTEAQSSSTAKSELRITAGKDHSIIDVSSSEPDQDSIGRNSFPVVATLMGELFDTEPQVGSNSIRMVKSEHIEQAMSSEGLTLV